MGIPRLGRSETTPNPPLTSTCFEVTLPQVITVMSLPPAPQGAARIEIAEQNQDAPQLP